MKALPQFVALVAALGALAGRVWATDVQFGDISSESPAKRYKVTAKSPDNRGQNERRAFPADFIYRCFDTQTGRLLWKRIQPMDKPSPEYHFSSPLEGSPTSVYVSDLGWTVIWTRFDELIVVDPNGHDRKRLLLLSEAFTKAERKEYFVEADDVGPLWAGDSMWYFVESGGRHLFVIRPWWGRRVIVELASGKTARESAAVSRDCLGKERDFIRSELAKGVKTRSQWENTDCCEPVIPIETAAFHAGRLHVLEAIPDLEKLQDSPFVGSIVGGGLAFGQKFEGEVSPYEYRMFTLRQVIDLSLRRLGRKPRPLPSTQFDVRYRDYKRNHPYEPATHGESREENASKVTAGMKAEKVLDLVGAPDFVGYDTWEYDMDASAPFSMAVKWKGHYVLRVQKLKPVLWKKGFIRDRQIVL